MTYDVFIVEGSAFDVDADFIELCGLSQSEAKMVQRITLRQCGLDFVIRPSCVEIYEKSTQNLHQEV